MSITPIIYVLSTGNYLLQDFCGWCYENNNSKFNSIKYQSLNDVVNNCITNMGKRKLKMRLIEIP